MCLETSAFFKIVHVRVLKLHLFLLLCVVFPENAKSVQNLEMVRKHMHAA